MVTHPTREAAAKRYAENLAQPQMPTEFPDKSRRLLAFHFEKTFLAGDANGFRRAVELLRSEEAKKQSMAWARDVELFRGAPAYAANWADWLESKLKAGDL